ncbi:phage tail sheath subtilisin-like domain-containing protein [Actinoplanes flavus]|uniref:Phage tail sheath subtilisin-like domain-containing protein n=1 Tax=Actinoplanes flavus TaxID=2820290 RepID=A0ABS3UTD0_9ACTN|nr:phage tail sheath subtilisin-like domain-containing protein [Actinoplanes flavus]MBO3741816.1 phage tail sheath subtilisin-like domain-containing protein [Actinoplanes flavus]
MTYQSPGVYVEEVSSGPQPIAAAPTSVVAVLGTTRKGPVLTPTRVTGWADFVRTFGTASARGYLAESVFGFFENGGPAAWVVRVDPSSEASWTAFDVSGTQSFAITASSPGAWGNTLTVKVRPDVEGASGAFYRASTTGPAVSVTNSGEHVLQVASTAGLRPGDTLALVPVPASGAAAAPVTATVVSLTPNAITLSSTGAAAMTTGSVVAGAAASGAPSVYLATGKGFRVGDVVVAVHPNGARSAARVTDVAPAGSAVRLALDASLGSVPGAAFVLRRANFPATAIVGGQPTGSPPSTSVPLSALAFERPLTAPVMADLSASAPQSAAARITTSDDRAAVWTTNRFDVVGSAPPPSGRVTVNAPVFAVLLADSGLSITNLTVADAANGYGFLPVGAQVTYTGAGATAVVATRTSTLAGFTLAPSPNPAHTYTDAAFTLQADADEGLAVRCAVAPRVGDRLAIGAAFAEITDMAEVGGDTYVLRFPASTAVSDNTQRRFGLYAVESASVVAERFAVTVSEKDAVLESFTGLSLSEHHPRYYAKDDVVNGVSALIRVAPRAAGAPAVSLAAAPFYVAPDKFGADKPATNDDFRFGITCLEEVPEPAMVICPDLVTVGDPLLRADLVGQIVAHCEEFRRFAIVDAPDEDDEALLAWRNTTVASTHAAVYAPHLKIVTIDPDAGDRFTTVPPSGFVAGVFARTDRLRGVHKAPGNEAVTGIVGLSRSYTQRRQDRLNPGGVNLIRAFPGRGTRLWGARNATDDTRWRYVNVRRLFNMIENSVDRATQWVVFEPNTAATWIRIKVSVENFLDQQWRAGALAGTRPEQAYRVRVGLGETMTEADIDLGLIITEVAIAPAKPAEFVVFRFSHKRLSE